ncbi:hypothetical protein N7526_008132 [Penicillium atrosanguineum]|nr:hypothetical protein N7526_008132 [Penicillium atrosanguineum]
MALKLLVNASLLVIPIGGSLGALFGIDAHRSATGQAPLFSGDSDSSGGGSTGGSTGGGSGADGSTSNNGITNSMYCQDSYGISPPSDGQLYTLNPNQWGLLSTTVGALCMNVTTNNNETYPTKYSAPQFSVTWKYEAGPETQPVHAYPNIMVDGILPVELGEMESLDLDLHWTYGVGNEPVETTVESTLTAETLNTNVAIDMFFDSDKVTAQNSSAAKYEVMIWFAKFGVATDPIGSKVTSRELNGTDFTLWAGNNSANQHVFTWIAADTTERFVGDINQLITDLYSLSGYLYPSSSDYLGVFSFGTEAFYSDSNVTFWVPKFSIDITKS